MKKQERKTDQQKRTAKDEEQARQLPATNGDPRRVETQGATEPLAPPRGSPARSKRIEETNNYQPRTETHVGWRLGEEEEEEEEEGQKQEEEEEREEKDKEEEEEAEEVQGQRGGREEGREKGERERGREGEKGGERG